MEWVGQAAGWLREILAQPWLDAWQSTIAQTPDWALFAAAPTVLLLFVLMLRLTWPRSQRPPRAKSETLAPPTPAPMQSRQEPAPLRVEPKSAATPQAPARTPAPKSVVANAAATPAPASTATSDDNEDRVVRVFISSTFIDMEGERKVLVKETFPALRAKFRARGVEFLAVDLRWGVTEDDVRTGKTLPICLREVDRCEPYFLGLLGERYGSLLTPDKLTPERIADFPVLGDGLGRSLTEIEIMQGALRKPKTANRALFFQRDPAWLGTLSTEERGKYETSSDEDRAKLAELKARIRASGAQIINYASPAGIGAAVEAALSEQIDAQFPDADAPTPFDLTMRLHRAYARERRGLHVGAAHYRAALDKWMANRDAPPLLITGESGAGKSTLVAHWLHDWRLAHPTDIVFEHYLGASPDSADPLLVIRRLWEQLNRDTGETVELPAGDVELMDFSSGLAQRLAQANAFAERKGARILIALDGFDKLSGAQDLRWLPNVPRVQLAASSLDGEAKSAALARGWTALEVKPLDAAERREFIQRTLEGWGRKLEPEHTTAILAHPQAGNPLFLRTVLDELRVSASSDSLKDRLKDYLEARDISDLFDRVLARLEDDCEPGLVAKALPVMWASRAGLEETEIIAITDTKPLFWATLRNGLGDGLRDSAGRLAFSHNYLSQAVAARYLNSDETRRAAHLAIADRFEAREADQRQAEELPYQLRAAKAWDRLEALLVDLDRFLLLQARGDRELWSYWRPLKQEEGRDPEALLCAAFERHAGDAAGWTKDDVDLASWICIFLDFAGAYGASRARLQQKLPAASERLFGPGHPKVATGLINLANLLKATNRHAEAEPLYRRALAIDEHSFGLDHPKVATGLINLANLLTATNRHVEAEPLVRRALAIDEQSFGVGHREVATDLNNLATLLVVTNRHAEAEPHVRRALAIYEQSFGPDHPKVAIGLSNLADLLTATNRHAEAEPLYRRALAIDEQSFGPGHPQVATDLNNLAALFAAINRHAEAEPLVRHALAIYERSFGPSHPNVARGLMNLANLLKATNRHAEAEPLYRRALAIDEQSFGLDHPKVATELNNLALLLTATNRRAEAEPLFRRALAIMEESFGPDHPEVALRLNNLAELLRATNRHAEAGPLVRRALAIYEQSFGPDHPNVARCLNNLAGLLVTIKLSAEAEPLFRRALAIMEESFGRDHPEVALGLNNLADLLGATNRHAEAEPLVRRALAIYQKSFGPDHPDVAIGLNNLASLCYATNRHAEAEPLFRRALAIMEESFGPEHPNVATSLNNLAKSLKVVDRAAEAEPLYRRALFIYEASFGPDHPFTKTAAGNLAACITELKR